MDTPPTTAVVYMLAHVRRGPYYIDVASDARAAHARGREIVHERMQSRQAIRDIAILVWYEICTDAAAAQARAAEIRKWPQAWQRRLIETRNPRWVDLDAVDAGFPAPLASLPEKENTHPPLP